MSNKLYEENDIQNIANAIRNKNGTEDTYKVSQMSTAIDSIEVIEQATAEGESLSLANTKAMPYSDYVVEGKSEQETRSGKNAIIDEYASASSYITWNLDKAKVQSSMIFSGIFSKSNNSTIYFQTSGGTIVGGSISITANQKVEKTITLSNEDLNKILNSTYMPRIQIYGGDFSDIQYSQIMYRNSNTDDTYEPYGEKPSPSNPSEIHSVGEVVLPSEYQQVEYITSDGNSYIDTNLQITGDFEIDLDFINNQTISGEQPIISIWTAQYNFWNLFIKADNRLEWYVNGHYLASSNPLINGEKNHIKIKRSGNNFVFFQNEAISSFTYSGDNNTTTLKIFKRGDLAGNSYVSIGSVTIKKNNMLVKKLIPCYKISDNTIGMYDIVNNAFISNSGTGNFAKGNSYIHSKDIITIKQRGTTESNDYTIQTEPLRSLPNGVKDTIEADGIHRRVGRQIVTTGTFYDGATWNGYLVFLSNKSTKNNNSLLCSNAVFVSSSSNIDGTVYENPGNIMFVGNNEDTLETLKSKYDGAEVLYELATEIIEPLTQNQATTMLDIIKTGSYEGTTNIYTDEDVKPTIGVDYYKKS